MAWGRRATAILVSTSVVFATVISVASADPVSDDTDLRDASNHGLAANIRYTEFGVPHIKAANFTGLGYGYGFAAAKDNLCELADIYLTVGAQRSRFLGPDAPANDAYGAASNSLNSDLFFQQVNDSGVVEHQVAMAAPFGPRPEVRDLIRGYVAGYNRFLRDTGVSRISDPACRGAAWMRPITELDVYRQFYALSTLAGAGQVIDGIANATPPVAAVADPPVPVNAGALVRDALGDKDMGSNAIAIGAAGTASHRGLLLGNPHYPWHGGRRFWEAQLTVPGRMDVSGAGLLGIPMVQIGFNSDVAWSHTVATLTTFGLYQVKLAPGTPTSYLVDGKPEAMTSRTVTVQVLGTGGAVSSVGRTLYSTRYGPVVSPELGLPLAWTTSSAYAVRDANQGNLRGLNTWFELGLARNTGDIVSVLSSTQGVPWVNTIATDRFGHALYADIQVAPNISEDLARRCNTPLGAAVYPGSGLTVFDGSLSGCAWGTDPDALVPGIFGPSHLPLLNRLDYVENSNDSAWLANPKAPITNYPRVIGDLGTPRNLRTRMGITAIEQQLATHRFTRQSLQDLLFSDQSYAGASAASSVASMCFTALPAEQSACTALSRWDETMRAGSRGALLFERFWTRAGGLPGLWQVPFNPADPVNTPNTLNTANPLVQKALADAIAELRTAGIAPDAPLGANHYVVRNGQRIGLPGGLGAQGVLNVITLAPWDPAHGDTEIVHGSSYIQAVSFTGDRCPDAANLLTYSQSGNPNSPHYADQTRLFAAGHWVRARFCESDILTSPDLHVIRLR
jgi:acyl-homoserine-lactone acylase